MSPTNVVKMLPRTLSEPLAQIRMFERDLVDLFTHKRQGHMEKWEYWDAEYPGDPAGGAAFWDALVKFPGAYYLPQSDMDLLPRAAANPPVNLVLRDLNTVVELGPGSPESISGKTMPFLQYAKNYIAVDQCIQQAEHAAEQVKRTKGIHTEAVIADYLHPQILKANRGKTAFVMWGGSIGNIPGKAGEDPLPKFAESLTALAKLCNPGDVAFVSIDTESRRDMLMNAYNVPMLSRKFLSILFAAQKFGLIAGRFTPQSWTHRSIWHVQSHQCAHYLIPSEDQDFVIGGQRVQIAAGKSVITNNSYKFDPGVAEEMARLAGFSRVYISDDRPMALLMATK